MFSEDNLKRSQKLFSEAFQTLTDSRMRQDNGQGRFSNSAQLQSLIALVNEHKKAVLRAELAYCSELYDRLKALQLTMGRAHYAIQDDYVNRIGSSNFNRFSSEPYQASEIQYRNRTEKLKQLYGGIRSWQDRSRKCLEDLNEDRISTNPHL
ncbi:hypothetical protein ACFQ4C_01590 [Larkinella insperata]|uniref:Uncharacterized protein n=1 Tax=Larkinella insperata TaxID=332158 RepID=A0ABW3Q466_9BACT|nr:hypothetical protein [Larkinella insperata]